MPSPMSSGQFGDLIDKRVTTLFHNELDNLPDMLPKLYSMKTSSDAYEKVSEVGELDDFTEFSGTVTYGSQSQGYDTTVTHLEFARGIQITRKLYDDDRHGVWERKPVSLANSWHRTRQKYGARMFNLGFSVDSFFYNNTESVALFSDSHTTTSGASTTVGFDNRVTSALSAVALSSARIQMRQFRGDVAQLFTVMPNQLLIPVDLCDRAYEIVMSEKKPDSAENNKNPQYDRFEVIEWDYLTDANNWFLMDSRLRNKWLVWYDRIPLEFARAEELDTLVAKWRAYARMSNAWFNWRWGLGAEVS